MSQSGIYSEDKLIWWYARDGGLPKAPKQVQLILSDRCDQDCSFCAYRMSGYTSNELFVGDSETDKYGHNNPLRYIPTERALSLLDEIKEVGALSVQLTGGGEPVQHPEHERIFQHALSLGLRCALVSNGVQWSNKLTTEILPEFDWVRVSIDSGNKSSYARIRRTAPKNWDTVWNNIHLLSDSIGAGNTQLGVGFVVTPDSWKEIRDFTRLAKASGAHNVRFTAVFSTEDEKPFELIYAKIMKEINLSRISFETESFKVFDNFGSRVGDLKQHSPDYSFCSYQHYTAYIGGDMKSYRCCLLAYNKRGLVEGGDLSKRSFKEFWESPERLKDMNALDATGCERCQFNKKNRGVLELMGDGPQHKEWP